MGHVVSSEPMSDGDLQRLQEQMTASSSLQGTQVYLRSTLHHKSQDKPPNHRGKRNSTLSTSGSVEESTGEECPICTEDILLRDLAKLDPCNHEFHQECINQWLEDHSSCPNCRADVSQVVFNYKRCSVRKFTYDSYDDIDDDEEHDDDDDDDDDVESIFTLDESNDAQVHPTNSHQPNQSDTTMVLGGDEILSPEWNDLSSLTDDSGGVSEEIIINIAEDKSVKLTFSFHTPEFVIESTDATIPWQLMYYDDVLAQVPAGGRVMIRGIYYLKLFKFSVLMDEHVVPFEDDKELNRLFYPSEECLIEMSQLQCNRHNRITEFFQYLRQTFTNED